MSRYCADFVGGAPYWFSDDGEFEGMPNNGFSCGRGWVIIQSHEFAELEPDQPQDPAGNPLIEPLSLMFAALMVALAAVWGAKRIYRLLITGGHHGD